MKEKLDALRQEMWREETADKPFLLTRKVLRIADALYEENERLKGLPPIVGSRVDAFVSKLRELVTPEEVVMGLADLCRQLEAENDILRGELPAAFTFRIENGEWCGMFSISLTEMLRSIRTEEPIERIEDDRRPN